MSDIRQEERNTGEVTALAGCGQKESETSQSLHFVNTISSQLADILWYIKMKQTNTQNHYKEER